MCCDLTNPRPGISQRPQTGCCPATAATPLRLFKKATVPKEWWETVVFWQFYSSFTHLFSIKLPFLGRMRVQWYRSPQTNVHPVATAARLRLLKRSGEAKRKVRQHPMPWQFCTSFTHLFSIKLPFLGWTRAINDIASHRPMFAPSPLLTVCVFINRAGMQKEWWDNIVCLDDFAIHSLTFFQLNRHFWGERVIHGIAAHRPMFAPSPLLPSCVY
jgi:hypothetical protein